MSNDYLDSLSKLARKRQLALTKEQEQAIYRVYDKAASNYYEKFVNGMGNSTATNALQMEYTRELATRLDTIIKEYSIKGAENSLGLVNDIMLDCYDEYGLKDTPYAKAVNMITNAAKDDAARRIILGDIYKDGKGLDSRIWNAANRSGEKVNEVIAACMAQQMSAVDMSKVLKDFMKPGGTMWDRNKIKEKLGPGYAAWNKEVSYEALRLARTTITHSATLAMKEASRVNPYLNSARWHSVHAVGRTCQDCKDRDGTVYSLAKLPFDHPNGLCWNEPCLDKSLDQICKELADWVEGGKNSRLDEYWKAHGPKDVLIPSKLPEDGKLRAIKPGTPEWYDKEFANFREQLGNHWENGIRQKIMDAPQFMQDWYRMNQHQLVYAGKDEDSAYYSPRDKWIKMNINKDGYINNSKGQYSTFFHEFGHLLDDKANLSDRGKLSYSAIFYNKIEKDFENQKRVWMNEYMDLGMSKDKAWEKVKVKFIKELRKDGDLASGCQDIIGGLTLNEIRAGWGHDKDYWTRFEDKRIDVISEMWAHMSSGYTNPERLIIMKKWFPTACEEFEDLVKINNTSQMKALNKK